MKSKLQQSLWGQDTWKSVITIENRLPKANIQAIKLFHLKIPDLTIAPDSATLTLIPIKERVKIQVRHEQSLTPNDLAGTEASAGTASRPAPMSASRWLGSAPGRVPDPHPQMTPYTHSRCYETASSVPLSPSITLNFLNNLTFLMKDLSLNLSYTMKRISTTFFSEIRFKNSF